MAGEYSLAQIKLNKARLIAKGFGVHKLKVSLFKTTEPSEDITFKTSKLGTPIVTDLTFQSGNFTPLEGGQPIPYKGIVIDTVIMTVSQSKNIVTTAIQGKSGTVKEYISDGDYEISVQGALVTSDGNKYPETEFKALSAIFSIPDTIKITSDFLGGIQNINPLVFSGIRDVIITDFSFPQQEGFRNTQLFQCRMITNNPIELTINN